VLALLDLGEAGAQHLLAVLEVLEVAALDLAGDDDPGGDVRQPDGGGGLVDLLPAGAGGAVDVHLDVLVAQLDRGVVRDLRHDLHAAKLVCRRAEASKGEMRTSRWTPFRSSKTVGVLTLDLIVADLMPASSPSCQSMSVHL
jgi:hypothetical protein